MSNIAGSIVSYDNDKLRSFINVIKTGYEESKRVIIPYNVWSKRAGEIITSQPAQFKTEIIQPGVVRYTDTKTVYAQLKSIEREIASLNEQIIANPTMAAELNQQLFQLEYDTLKPVSEFYYDGITEIDGVPAWYSSTLKGVNIRIGPENLDLSQPCGFYLSSDKVHANVQGSTGSGKTVMMTNLIFNIMMEYPPWEVDLKLIDNKIAEFHLFARAAQAPHATVVAATKSKDFLLDLYSTFVEETNMRQEIFNATQCNSKQNFRKKFNLILPEVVIIIDEYVAMLKAIEDTAVLGNQHAGEEKQAIESVLFTMATQSRNAGIHFLISSQDLGSKLNENISKQIHVGATLAGTPDIFTGCINNSKVFIDRKGLCVVNTERMMADNSCYNKTVGVPYLSTDAAPGELLNDAQKLLIKIADKARDLNFKKEFYFYDAEVKISSQKYQEEMSNIMPTVGLPDSDLVASIPLGYTVSYKNLAPVNLEVRYRKGDNIIFYSTTDSISRYIARVISLSTSLEHKNLKICAYYTDKTALEVSELTDSDLSIETTEVKLLASDDRLFRTCSNRVYALQVQDVVFKRANYWDWLVVMQVVASGFSGINVYQEYKNKCETVVLQSIVEDWNSEKKAQILEDIKEQDKSKFANFLSKLSMLSGIRKSHGVSDTQMLTPQMFQPILNFWFGIEDIDNVRDDEIMSSLIQLFTYSTTVNIINVANSKMFSKVRRLLGGFNYILEFANKDFYSEAEMGSYIANVNKDSFILHDKGKSKHTTIKIYGGI